jgi:hypothetical protein
MADWPDVDELKQLLDVTSADFDQHLEGLMDAGIARVKSDVGSWDEDEDPDELLAKAAMRAAIVMQVNGGDGTALDTDGRYQSLLKGHRRRFGFA